LNKRIKKKYEKYINQAFLQVWKLLAPEISSQAYLKASHEYRKLISGFNRPKHFGNRIVTREEAREIQDNSAFYEDYTYIYEGLESVQEMVSAEKPVVFALWHHGAIHHNDYGISRVFPQLAIFTKFTFQYGKVFSFPTGKSQALNLVRMDRFLRESRPVLYYLDGIPLGETVTLPILGTPASISTAPIGVIRSVEGIKIVPVTTNYRIGKKVEIKFHPPSPTPEKIPEMSKKEILEALLDFFEKDKKSKAPGQVMWWYIVFREYQAKKMMAERRIKSQEIQEKT